MNQAGTLSIALNEFIHVFGALIVIIAVVSVLTGLMREYIPQEKFQNRVSRKGRFGSFIGASLGILTPFCSASVVPVSMGMAEMGVSISTIFGFLISAPLCNFVVVGMILAVFGLKVALVYFTLTFSSAIISGFLIGCSPWRNEVKRGAELVQSKKPVQTCGVPSKCGAPIPVAIAANTCKSSLSPKECSAGSPQQIIPSMQPASASCTPHMIAIEPISNIQPACCGAPTVSIEASHKEKFHNALLFAWALFKRIIPYVLIGAVISGLSAAYLPGELVEKYVGGDSWYTILIAAGIGVPLYLRIEMAIPLLKVLIAKGMGMGAAMALLIGGTGASLPEIALISSVLKPKGVVAFVSAVFTTAVIGGLLYKYVI